MKHMIGASSASDKVYAAANQAVTEAVGAIRVVHVRRRGHMRACGGGGGDWNGAGASRRATCTTPPPYCSANA